MTPVAAIRGALAGGFAFLRLAGRCADGAERDGGTRYHVVPKESRGRALCGAVPGRRSAGWSAYPGEAATCPRCVRQVERAAPPAVLIVAADAEGRPRRILRHIASSGEVLR